MVLVVMHQWTLALLHLTMDQAVVDVRRAWSTAGYVVAPLVVPVIIVMDMVARHLSLQMLGKKSSQASRCCWLLWLALRSSFQVHLLEKQCQQRLLKKNCSMQFDKHLVVHKYLWFASVMVFKKVGLLWNDVGFNCWCFSLLNWWFKLMLYPKIFNHCASTSKPLNCWRVYYNIYILSYSTHQWSREWCESKSSTHDVPSQLPPGTPKVHPVEIVGCQFYISVVPSILRLFHHTFGTHP